MMASLVQERHYDEAGSHMLPVGHTHEDVGGLLEQKNCFWSLTCFLLLKVAFAFFSFVIVTTKTAYSPTCRRTSSMQEKTCRRFMIFKGRGCPKYNQKHWALAIGGNGNHFTQLICNPVRLLQNRVAPVFHNRGEFFQVILMDRVSYWSFRLKFLSFNQGLFILRYDDFTQFEVHDPDLDEVRPWKDLAPKITSLDNAYRPRKGEEDLIPHSFVFQRRESCSDLLYLMLFLTAVVSKLQTHSYII